MKNFLNNKNFDKIYFYFVFHLFILMLQVMFYQKSIGEVAISIINIFINTFYQLIFNWLFR